MNGVAFLDTETTGLDPRRHDVWEIAYLLRMPDEPPDRAVQRSFLLEVNLSRAEPTALRIGHYYERTASGEVAEPYSAAEAVARDLANRHIVGAVPDFDARFLDVFLRSYGYSPAWHYHLIDVESLMAGALLRLGALPDLPWSSHRLAAVFGIEQPEGEEHTALGDARWAMRCFDAVRNPATKIDLTKLDEED